MGKGMFRKSFTRRNPPADIAEYERRRELRGYTSQGQEMDPIPVAPPIGYKKQPTMVEHIRSLIRSEKLREEAENAGAETFDEADDFGHDDDEDYVPLSGYESEFDPPAVTEAKRRFAEQEEKERDHGTSPPDLLAPEKVERVPLDRGTDT